MSKRKLTKFEKQALNSPTCLFWPDCACYENIVHWQEALDDADRTFTTEQLEAAEEVIFYSCACAAEHCPAPKTKLYAARQVADLTLRRQRIAAAHERGEESDGQAAR